MIRSMTAGVVAAVLAGVSGAQAGSVLFSGDSGYASFAGEMKYLPDQQQLVVSLRNTSPAANGGYITGFAFDTDADPGLTLGDGGAFVGLADVKAPPLGWFDAGAALGGKWTGGGKPSLGIATGDTRSFVFTVKNTGAWDSDDFWNDQASVPLAVRFRGFNDGGSEKLVGGDLDGPPPVVPPPPVAQIIPLPPAGWTALTAMALMPLPALARRVRLRRPA